MMSVPSFSVVKETKTTKFGLMDALSLIPEFSGKHKEIEFVYFREGCRNALDLLEDSNKYSLILPFLKNKLKGNAFTSFGLKVSTYLSVSDFLKDVKEMYAQRCDEKHFWGIKMMKTLQEKGQSLEEFIAIFQEMLQCAIIGIKYSDTYEKKYKDDEIADIEDIAATLFIKNMQPSKIQKELKTSTAKCNSKKLFEIITTAIKLNESNKIVSPKPCEVCGSTDHTDSECECIVLGLEHFKECERKRFQETENAKEQNSNMNGSNAPKKH